MENKNLKIQIKNYGLIEDAEIEFYPGLNIIIGESGNGKSTLLRAIYATIFNDTGDNAVRMGAKGYYIKIDYKGHTIEKTRELKEKDKGSVVKYVYDGKLYEKLAGKPLQNCLDDFGMREIELTKEKEHINFSTQFSKPFLIDESPSKIFEILTVADSNVNLLEILTEIKKDTSELQKQRELKNTEITTLKQIMNEEKRDIERVKNIDEIYDEINKYEENINKLGKINQYIVLINENEKEYNRNEVELNRIKNDYEIYEKELPKKEYIEEIYKLENHIENFKEYNNKLKNNKIEIDNIEKEYKKLDILDSINISDLIQKEEKYNKINKYIEEFNLSRKNIKEITEEENKINKIIKYFDDIDNIDNINKLETYINNFRELYKKIKELDIENIKNKINNIFSYNIDFEYINKLQNYIYDFKDSRENMIKLEKEIKDIENELKDCIKEISEYKICPLCGNKLNKNDKCV